ncbi:uncharacterized [Tachysurus ichikawai]
MSGEKCEKSVICVRCETEEKYRAKSNSDEEELLEQGTVKGTKSQEEKTVHAEEQNKDDNDDDDNDDDDDDKEEREEDDDGGDGKVNKHDSVTQTSMNFRSPVTHKTCPPEHHSASGEQVPESAPEQTSQIPSQLNECKQLGGNGANRIRGTNKRTDAELNRSRYHQKRFSELCGSEPN